MSNSHSDLSQNIPIIALGASAGGLEAFRGFFQAMPSSTGMAFIVIQHIAADYKSTLHEILQHDTSMPVQAIDDDSPIEPDQVYVLPAGHELRIQDRRLYLTAHEENRGWPRTIDRFLKLLASDQGPLACAVILSGLGDDGMEGAQAIREAGGLVIAQDTVSASQPSMPMHVIQAELADHTLWPEQMPQFIMAHFHIKADDNMPLPELMEHISGSEIADITRYLQQMDHNFTDYKLSTLQRQVARRMSIQGFTQVAEYLAYMKQHPQEADQLAKYLLINVTSFFRNPEAFESLKQKALLPMLGSLSIDTDFRIWVPGCATGEEAVSIGILVYECLRELNMQEMPVRIFATDISTSSLRQARTGLYPASIKGDITPERLNNHMMPDEGGYRVRGHISRMIVWSEHNLVEHPPFSHLHLISCRNVLIYFQRHLQQRLMALFQFTLQPGGVLFLGSAENPNLGGETFSTIDSRNKIFQCHASSKHAWLQLDQPLFSRIPDYSKIDMDEQKTTDKQRADAELELIKSVLIDHYQVTCALIDEHYRLTYTYGKIDQYLRIVPGREGQHNILDMAREGLDIELTVMLYQSLKDGSALTHQSVRMVSSSGEQLVNLTTIPISQLRSGSHHWLILFDTVSDDEVQDTDDEAGHRVGDQQGATVDRLQSELAETRKTLQNVTQALQAKNEELTSSMEEISSANEEVQTTNEELRTSREELVSMNEELNTLNSQLISQNQALTVANNTLHNFLQSSEASMIFLDQNMCIREYTTAITELFSLRPTDKNRPLTEISNNLNYKDLISDAEKVLDTLQNREVECQATSGRWYTLHIRPYRTMTEVIDGVVLTFADITSLKHAQSVLAEQFDVIQRMMQTTQSLGLLLEADMRIAQASAAFCTEFGLSTDDTTGQSLLELEGLQWDEPALRRLLANLQPGQSSVVDDSLMLTIEGRGRYRLSVSAQPMPAQQQILLMITDMSAYNAE